MRWNGLPLHPDATHIDCFHPPYNDCFQIWLDDGWDHIVFMNATYPGTPIPNTLQGQEVTIEFFDGSPSISGTLASWECTETEEEVTFSFNLE